MIGVALGEGELIDLAGESAFSLGAMHVDPPLRVVRAGSRTQTVEPKVMQVLVVMARSRGCVVSRDALGQACWGGRVVGDEALNRCIAAIRRLGEAFGGFSVTTVARVGYRLDEQFAGNVAAPPAAIPLLAGAGAGAVGDAGSAGRPSRKILVMFAAALVALAVAALAAALPRNGAQVEPERVALFGFVPADAASGREADETTDEVFAEFARVGVQAVARSETVGAPATERLERARKLGAAFALSGEVRADGDRVVSVLRLEDTATRATVWEFTQNAPAQARYRSAPRQAAFRAAYVVDCILGLQARLTKPAREQLANVSRYCGSSGFLAGSGTEGALAAAQELARGEPKTAYFQTLLANALINLGGDLPPELRSVRLNEALAAVDRAKSLAPGDPALVATEDFVRSSLGASPLESAALLGGATAGAARDEAVLNYRKGLHLLANGRTSEAVALAKAAEATHASLGLASVLRAYGLASLGQAADAEDLFQQAFMRAPDALAIWQFWALAAVMEGVGDPDAVLDAAPAGTARTEVDCWRARLDATRKAKRRVSIPDSCPDRFTSALSRGDVDEAFEAYRDGYSPASPLRVPDWRMRLFAPSARALRADPRFIDLSRELALWDYWITTRTQPDVCASAHEQGYPLCVALRDAQAAERSGP